MVAYGTPARIALTAVETLRAEGLKVGLYPSHHRLALPRRRPSAQAAKPSTCKGFLDVEMSPIGQMVDDVRLAVDGQIARRILRAAPAA